MTMHYSNFFKPVLACLVAFEKMTAKRAEIVEFPGCAFRKVKFKRLFKLAFALCVFGQCIQIHTCFQDVSVTGKLNPVKKLHVSLLTNRITLKKNHRQNIKRR